ncbi:MAG: CehA/McbA family metallohydrolase, partial [Verrucomicrobiales bacterium]|nr:CehA/McbA family metallohydrolase [Verrucomicrobiales bacterium]
VRDVELQPLGAQAKRLIEALDFLGTPLTPQDVQTVERAVQSASNDTAVETIQQTLDKYCLAGVNINPESRVKVARGPAKAELLEQGWRAFLVKVHNEAGVTAELLAVSPNAKASYEGGWRSNSDSDQFYRRQGNAAPANLSQRDLWLEMQSYTKQPLTKNLSGLKLEYRILQLYSRDAGKREAKLSFNVGQGTQDIGYRNDVDILFTCVPTQEITFRVRDEDNKPTTAGFVIRDAQGHVYPSQAKRLAPDFPFHPQVYRADGEKLKLPDGTYTVEFSRGPESVPFKHTITVGKKSRQFPFKVERWIDPSKFGWWSGDHHIHAAGCAHYTKPTEGVHAEDMIRHCLGEDLKVGCNLTWGPCFDYQKQFFTGQDDKVSKFPYLLHYDVEVSGFGSHNSGHLCLLRLTDQIYPGGESKTHWPTLCLNTLRWARKQGAVVGPAHSGWGLDVDSNELPNYVVPPFNGIGANEYIVDVTHEIPGPDGKLVRAVDFISTVDTPYVWELNIWYHTLNAGFRTRISGETDFPCIYGERVGLGRSYVKLAGKLDYGDWCEGIRQGRNYVSDGRSHLMDLKVNHLSMGENGSELKLAQPGTVRVSARVAARLNETADPTLQKRPYREKPYWDIERARIGETREVPVELVVNGYPVAKKNIVADGKLQDVAFDAKIDRSSWVTMRILPSSHTNPIFILVGDKPIRASRRSVDWCLKGVDQCWSQKERHIKADEMDQAKKDYEHARQTYRKLLAECDVD